MPYSFPFTCGGEEKILTFATDESTKITKAGKTMTFADLKGKMAVSVEYKVEMGKHIAATVKIATPKPAPKTGK